MASALLLTQSTYSEIATLSISISIVYLYAEWYAKSVFYVVVFEAFSIELLTKNTRRKYIWDSLLIR